MIYVELPEELSQNHPLGFYLAMEEHLARHYSHDRMFFLWQVDPTVICGRNQDIPQEVNIDYCKKNNISIVRRKSGGGSVFADRKNLMFSYICNSDNVRSTFSHFTGSIVDMLRALGLDASDNSRNDILIADRKVSGCAYYHLPGKSIVHCTMLFDTDFTHIANALTPSRAKLLSKGVKSVPSRITTIREHLPELSIEEFKTFARQHLCNDKSLTLSPADVDDILKLREFYYDDNWTFKPIRHFHKPLSAHIDGVGQISISYSLDSEGLIDSVSLSGDFFGDSDVNSSLTSILKGTPPLRNEIARVLNPSHLSSLIIGLQKEDFVELFPE